MGDDLDSCVAELALQTANVLGIRATEAEVEVEGRRARDDHPLVKGEVGSFLVAHEDGAVVKAPGLTIEPEPPSVELGRPVDVPDGDVDVHRHGDSCAPSPTTSVTSSRVARGPGTRGRRARRPVVVHRVRVGRRHATRRRTAGVLSGRRRPFCYVRRVQPAPAFATDPATAAYYDRRASEYDEWYTGEGLFERRERPGWHDDVARIVELVRRLPPARTLDVACGTAFLTRHLQGDVVGTDQSPAMVAIARSRLRSGLVLVGDALQLAVGDHAVDRVFTGHFYGHLPPFERDAFLQEARRVAAELVVIDAARRPGIEPEQWQERVLNDGSRHRVYKRYFTAEQLADELGGEVLFDGEWFVAASATW